MRLVVIYAVTLVSTTGHPQNQFVWVHCANLIFITSFTYSPTTQATAARQIFLQMLRMQIVFE